MLSSLQLLVAYSTTPNSKAMRKWVKSLFHCFFFLSTFHFFITLFSLLSLLLILSFRRTLASLVTRVLCHLLSWASLLKSRSYFLFITRSWKVYALLYRPLSNASLGHFLPIWNPCDLFSGVFKPSFLSVVMKSVYFRLFHLLLSLNPNCVSIRFLPCRFVLFLPRRFIAFKCKRTKWSVLFSMCVFSNTFSWPIVICIYSFICIHFHLHEKSSVSVSRTSCISLIPFTRSVKCLSRHLRGYSRKVRNSTNC